MHYLIGVLNKAREVYEQGTDEIMSNYEYDKLYDELLSIEAELGMALNNSPTQRVGYEVVSKLPKETHATPMLSLDKTKDRESLVSWLNGKEGILSWKMDGLTVVLTYEDGKLVKAVTRGNGEVGEVVTPNVKQFKNVPRHIAFKGKLVLRGEAIITYSDFEKINSNIALDDEKYKNPRNLCSGSVRQLDSGITAQRNVKWYAFEIVEAGQNNLVQDVEKQLTWLKLLGFSVVEYESVTPANILQAIERFSTKVKTNDVPTDGLVLTYKDKEYGKSLGRTSKFPRHSIAFKWQDETAISTIEFIEWSPSRTGLINPVAVFKPVDIEGSTVQRASVHNVSIFADLELGYGDRVEVYKANMIIPQISDNLDRTATCEIPAHCPCCGCETEIHEDPNSGVLTLWCMNADCDAKGNRLFEHFVSRDAMNIDGISKATLVTFAEAGIISDLASIFKLAEHQDEIVNLEGFGFKSFYNMINAIEKARDVKLANLIYSLGIPNIGLATAKLICKNFGYDMKSTVTATYDQLIQIEGIGDVIAESFVDYFANSDNANHFVRLLNEVRLIKEEVSTDTSMSGVTICVTGDVYIFPNRRAVKEIVENMGGKLTGSVSRSTSYLVTNDTTSGSNKNKAAQAYGIPILTEQEFIDKFNIQI
ncbi:MAG: NAD-dependent DNA ligase LigA [Lachnospiraceae bacterium]|nr:NAD-dependent DNA ligase LigA [Lachnospiraceae bacterium]